MLIASAVTVLAVVDDGSDEALPAGVSALGASRELPPAPWRAAPVPRAAVPAPYTEAWDRAGNRQTCALLFPSDGGPEMPNAKPSSGPTPDDKGWDIFLTGDAGTIEILALFDKKTLTNKQPTAPSITMSWSDGSVAKYSADVGNLAPGTYDPATSPFEAVLTLPDQSCAYRIHDTLGKTHLEALFDRLRLMAS